MMTKPVIGIVTTWFERGAAYVSRAYSNVLADEFDVQIYARGGEEYVVDDPNWSGSNVWWAGPEFAGANNVGRFDLDDYIRWICERNIQAIIFNEQEWWWPPIFRAQI